MGLYGVGMSVTRAMSVSVVMVAIVKDKVDAFGSIEYLDMGRIVHQALHPCLFEADVSDAKIGFAISKGNQLLGDRVVCLRAGTFGNHADYLELVSCDGFGEITLRFECDGNHWLFSIAVIAFGRTSCAGCQ